MSGPPAALRPTPPAALPAAEAEAIDRLVAAAVADQRRNVADGLEGALARVPRILRGPVRRVAGG